MIVKKLSIVCPICLRHKRIGIPPEIFNIDEGSLLKLPISKNMICEHSFVALIDYHFKIRDYEIIKSNDEYEKYCKKSQKEKDLAIFSLF